MTKLIIGITGPPAAGKETVAQIIADELKAKDLRVYRGTFSDVLYETLDIWGLAKDRSNAQRLAVVMRNAFGPTALTDAVAARAANTDAHAVIIDGVRWLVDEDLIRSFPNNLVIAVGASPKERWGWARARKEKAGEETVSWEEFQAQDQAENERFV
ncbi:MAG: AAA family ATPase, partial [Patescibacteria group bacterium]